MLEKILSPYWRHIDARHEPSLTGYEHPRSVDAWASRCHNAKLSTLRRRGADIEELAASGGVTTPGKSERQSRRQSRRAGDAGGEGADFQVRAQTPGQGVLGRVPPDDSGRRCRGARAGGPRRS